MYNAGQMQLQSANWLNSHTGDRPSFHAKVCRTFSTRTFQVFAMQQGLLFLESRGKGAGGASDEQQQKAMMMGMFFGGVLGAAVAQAVVNNMPEQPQENFDLCSEEELFELAKRRKRSFVAKNDEILSVSIDAPRGFSRLFADSTLAGTIVVRDRRLGKLTLEVHDQAALSVAVDALPRRFADRCFVNVELDRNTAKFVSLGR
jgi:hypothetical protein